MVSCSAHPCFDDRVRHRFARVHLPVAPQCNMACNYCSRRYDCVNESRPGVTSTVLSPAQAVAFLEHLAGIVPQPITVVGIAGPGDPFACPAETLDTLRRVRAAHPDILLCVATNGLALLPHVPALADLKVSHVTLTVNAVDPMIGARIYRWVRPTRQRVLRGSEGAAFLLECQRDAVVALKRHGITVKINTIVIPGINEDHVPEVARRMAALGADVQNCIPIYPVADTPFAEVSPPSAERMARLREEASVHLPQMSHCARCRADAAGLIGETGNPEVHQLLRRIAAGPLEPTAPRPYVAVASREGVLVNLHLGQAETFWIYGWDASGVSMLIDRRQAPPPGDGDERWRKMAAVLHDCQAVLVSQAGARPRAVLSDAGLKVHVGEGVIDEIMEDLRAGRTPRAVVRRGGGCGSSCGRASVARAEETGESAGACACPGGEGRAGGCGASGCPGTGTGCG